MCVHICVCTHLTHHVVHCLVTQVQTIQKRMILPHVTSDMWTDAHIEVLKKFFVPQTTSHHLLVVSFAGELLTVQNSPPAVAQDCIYFFRTDSEPISRTDQFESHVQYGLIKKGDVDSLANMMNAVFSPLLARNRNWPVSVQVYLSSPSDLHCCTTFCLNFFTSGPAMLHIITHCTHPDFFTLDLRMNLHLA